MLIKYYALNNDIILIEGASDVEIIANYGEHKGDEYRNYVFDHQDKDTSSFMDNAQVIQYAKDGPCRLFVFGTAYLCSDDGKTVHKVEGKYTNVSEIPLKNTKS